MEIGMAKRLLLKPCTLSAANQSITLYHRLHCPAIGAKTYGKEAVDRQTAPASSSAPRATHAVNSAGWPVNPPPGCGPSGRTPAEQTMPPTTATWKTY